MFGNNSEQNSRATQVKESSTLEREERGAVRSHQLDHTQRQRTKSAGTSLQSTRTVPFESRNQFTLPGSRVNVPSRHFGIFSRGRQKAPRGRHTFHENGKGRFRETTSRRFALRHVRQEQRRRNRAGNAELFGDRGLLDQRRDGLEGSNTGRKVRDGLHLVRRRDPQSY